MDTQSSDSTSALDVNQAAAAFASAFEPQPAIPEETKVDTEIDLKKAEETPSEPVEASEETPADEPATVPVVINGKTVEVPLTELTASYQKDKAASEKFEQAAALRKTADAEIAKTQAERANYADQLNRLALQTEVQLQQDAQTDWAALLKSDPVEYLERQRLANERQAYLNQVNQQLHAIAMQTQAEQQQAHQSYLQEQQQALLDKLPAWKDSAKALAERDALKTYLKGEGYDDASITGISDHKAVILARKAMLYDQIVNKAAAATKKVAALPQKVERPGVADSGNVDKRSALYQKLSKSGSVDHAAALFSSIL